MNCIPLERRYTSGSNAPPQTRKVQIPHTPGMGDSQIPVHFPMGDAETLKWLAHCAKGKEKKGWKEK